MKTIITLLLICCTHFSWAQKNNVELQIKKAFDAIKNNDIETYKKIWPSGTVFCEIIHEKKDDIPPAARQLYCESNYYRMLGKMMEEFLEKRYSSDTLNWQQLAIQAVHIDTFDHDNKEAVQEYDGYLWIKNTSDKSNWIVRFRDVLMYKNETYGGRFREIEPLDDMTFQDKLKELTESTEATVATAADTTITVSAEELAMAVADSAATALAMIEESEYVGTVNGKTIKIQWKVTGYDDDRYYNQTEYKYTQQESDFFAQVTPLGNQHYLMIEQGEQNYFRLKKNGSNLSGVWFSSKLGKEYPVVLNEVLSTK